MLNDVFSQLDLNLTLGSDLRISADDVPEPAGRRVVEEID